MTHKTRNRKCRPATSKGVFTCYINEGGEFSWRMTSKANGQVVTIPGEGFETDASCKQSIANLKRDAAGAKIVNSPTFAADIATARAAVKAAKLAALAAAEAVAQAVGEVKPEVLKVFRP